MKCVCVCVCSCWTHSACFGEARVLWLPGFSPIQLSLCLQQSIINPDEMLAAVCQENETQTDTCQENHVDSGETLWLIVIQLCLIQSTNLCTVRFTFPRACVWRDLRRDVCSNCPMLFLTLPLCADERDVCQEQRFLPDGRRPAEHHGRTRGSVLAGHSAASSAHREGTVKPHKAWLTLSMEYDFTALQHKMAFTYQRLLISINDSAIIWPAAEISGFESSVFFSFLACSG